MNKIVKKYYKSNIFKIINQNKYNKSTLNNVLERNFDDLNKINVPIPKIESIILYRNCLKICKKFYWYNDNGKQWSEILKLSIRKDFENNRKIDDSVEAGKKQIQGRQALIEIDNKLAKVNFDISKFLTATKNDSNVENLYNRKDLSINDNNTNSSSNKKFNVKVFNKDVNNFNSI